ncbi:MAG: TRAP transporter small permease [Candidatus Auribacterota bacterium]
MKENRIPVIDALNNAITWVEKLLLTIMLAAMIVVQITQIIMRNISDTGLLAADLIVRHFILWVALVGASLTTYYRSHIKIDLVNRFVPKKAQRWLAIITDFMAMAVCIWLTKAGYAFLIDEYQYGGNLVGSFPRWVILIVIPLWFGVISFRFAVCILHDFRGKE